MGVWTTPATWAASEVPTSTKMNQQIKGNFEAINGFVRKTADEDVTSSAVLQNDDHLSYTIGAAGTYVVDVHLIGTSAANAAGDLNLAFTFPTGTFYLTAIGLDSSLASGSTGTVQTIGGSITSGTAFATYGLSTSQNSIILNGTFVATATGTLQLQWCQGVSNANKSTLKTGSSMKVRQVA